MAPDNDSGSEGGDDGELEGNAHDGNSEDEVSDDDIGVSDHSAQSDQDEDLDPDAGFLSGEEDEETMEGEYGFGGF